VVQVDFANHDRVTPERVVELVGALRAGAVPAPSRGRAPNDFREASRILAGGSGGSRSEHVSVSGSPPRAGAEETT